MDKVRAEVGYMFVCLFFVLPSGIVNNNGGSAEFTYRVTLVLPQCLRASLTPWPNINCPKKSCGEKVVFFK